MVVKTAFLRHSFHFSQGAWIECGPLKTTGRILGFGSDFSMPVLSSMSLGVPEGQLLCDSLGVTCRRPRRTHRGVSFRRSADTLQMFSASVFLLREVIAIFEHVGIAPGDRNETRVTHKSLLVSRECLPVPARRQRHSKCSQDWSCCSGE
jgi:hypothetical protein